MAGVGELLIRMDSVTRVPEEGATASATGLLMAAHDIAEPQPHMPLQNSDDAITDGGAEHALGVVARTDNATKQQLVLPIRVVAEGPRDGTSETSDAEVAGRVHGLEKIQINLAVKMAQMAVAGMQEVSRAKVGFQNKE